MGGKFGGRLVVRKSRLCKKPLILNHSIKASRGAQGVED